MNHSKLSRNIRMVRSRKNVHRDICRMNGRLYPFGTHKKDIDRQVASLFSHLNAVSGAFRNLVAGTLLALLLSGGSAFALPTGWSIVSGDVTVTQADSTTLNVVSATENPILNWQTFNLAQSETLNFSGGFSNFLNNITGGQTSSILGTINSSGNLFLVNPAGISIGSTANLNVASLVASTLPIGNTDFLNGNYTFRQQTGLKPTAIINQGTIKATPGGFVVLAGGVVKNTGNIFAPQGDLHLAVGNQITMNLDPVLGVKVTIDEALKKSVSGFSDAILNAGVLQADGGLIALQAKLEGNLYARVVNNTNRVQANSVAFNTGEILFSAEGGTGLVQSTGFIQANAAVDNPTGGDIKVSAGKVVMTGALEGGDIEITTTGSQELASPYATGNLKLTSTDANNAAIELDSATADGDIQIETQGTGTQNDITVNGKLTAGNAIALSTAGRNSAIQTGDIDPVTVDLHTTGINSAITTGDVTASGAIHIATAEKNSGITAGRINGGSVDIQTKNKADNTNPIILGDVTANTGDLVIKTQDSDINTNAINALGGAGTRVELSNGDYNWNGGIQLINKKLNVTSLNVADGADLSIVQGTGNIFNTDFFTNDLGGPRTLGDVNLFSRSAVSLGHTGNTWNVNSLQLVTAQQPSNLPGGAPITLNADIVSPNDIRIFAAHDNSPITLNGNLTGNHVLLFAEMTGNDVTQAAGKMITADTLTLQSWLFKDQPTPQGARFGSATNPLVTNVNKLAIYTPGTEGSAFINNVGTTPLMLESSKLGDTLSIKTAGELTLASTHDVPFFNWNTTQIELFPVANPARSSDPFFEGQIVAGTKILFDAGGDITQMPKSILITKRLELNTPEQVTSTTPGGYFRTSVDELLIHHARKIPLIYQKGDMTLLGSQVDELLNFQLVAYNGEVGNLTIAGENDAGDFVAQVQGQIHLLGSMRDCCDPNAADWATDGMAHVFANTIDMVSGNDFIIDGFYGDGRPGSQVIVRAGKTLRCTGLVSGDNVSLNSQNGDIGLDVDNPVRTAAHFLQSQASNGNVWIDQFGSVNLQSSVAAGDFVLSVLRACGDSAGRADLTVLGEVTGGRVFLSTENGDILDGNGDDNNVRSTGNAFFSAGGDGIIGTGADPFDIQVGGQAFVEAGGTRPNGTYPLGISVNVNGSTGDDTLNLITDLPPGEVFLNGRRLFRSDAGSLLGGNSSDDAQNLLFLRALLNPDETPPSGLTSNTSGQVINHWHEPPPFDLRLIEVKGEGGGEEAFQLQMITD